MAVAGKTFVELANEAMEEMGVDTAPISHAEGADPHVSIHRKVLRWVSRSWLEIQLSRSDWDWKNQHDILTLYPRIMVRTPYATSLSTLVDAIVGTPYLITDDAELSYEVRSVIPAKEAGPYNSTYSYWFVDLVGDADSRISTYPELGGNLNLYDGVTDTTHNVTFLSYGKYDLTVEQPKLFNAPIRKMDMVIPSTGSATYFPVEYYTSPVAYSATVGYDGNSYGAYTDADGFLVFVHPLTETINLRLFYEPRPQELVEMSDVPEGLDPEFHDMIMWRAVKHYADWDKKPQLFMTASKRYAFYESQVDKRHLPPVRFTGNTI